MIYFKIGCVGWEIGRVKSGEEGCSRLRVFIGENY